MTDLPHLYTLAEAARAIRVSHSTLLRQRDLGLLECTCVGRRVFITRDQLTDYLNQQRRRGACNSDSLTTTDTTWSGGPIHQTTPSIGALPARDASAVEALEQRIWKRPSGS